MSNAAGRRMRLRDMAAVVDGVSWTRLEQQYGVNEEDFLKWDPNVGVTTAEQEGVDTPRRCI